MDFRPEVTIDCQRLLNLLSSYLSDIQIHLLLGDAHGHPGLGLGSSPVLIPRRCARLSRPQTPAAVSQLSGPPHFLCIHFKDLPACMAERAEEPAILQGLLLLGSLCSQSSACQELWPPLTFCFFSGLSKEGEAQSSTPCWREGKASGSLWLFMSSL